MGKGSSPRPFSVDSDTYGSNYDAIFKKQKKEEDMTFSTKNPHSVSNVNVAQGPHTGNKGTPSKRADFKSAKEERAPLAGVIAKAYGERSQKDSIDTKLEGIEPNVKPRKFKR